MVTITLYAKQKKRHRCTEQTFRLCGRRRGWDVLREQYWNKYTIKGEIDHQPRLDARDKCSGLVHWEDPEGWDGGGRGGSVISLQLIKINGKKRKNVNNHNSSASLDHILKSVDSHHIHWSLFLPHPSLTLFSGAYLEVTWNKSLGGKATAT